MKEFIEKLIGRLEEKFKYNSEQAEIWRNGSDKDAYFRAQKDLYMDRANTYGEVMRIVNKLAEEYKTKTNADRIRSMSDEELAELLKMYVNCTCEFCVGCGSSCSEHNLKWLQSEAE